jgi:hypothetical protein
VQTSKVDDAVEKKVVTPIKKVKLLFFLVIIHSRINVVFKKSIQYEVSLKKPSKYKIEFLKAWLKFKKVTRKICSFKDRKKATWLKVNAD